MYMKLEADSHRELIWSKPVSLVGHMNDPTETRFVAIVYSSYQAQPAGARVGHSESREVIIS